MNFVRVGLSVIALWVFYYLMARDASLVENAMSRHAYAFLFLLFSVTAYLLLKNYCFVYRVNREKGAFINIFEVFVVPVAPVFSISFPLLVFDIFELKYLVILGFIMIATWDPNGALGRWAWEIRFYEFANFPDSGVVNKKDLDSLDFYITCLVVGLPLVAWMMRMLYGFDLW